MYTFLSAVILKTFFYKYKEHNHSKKNKGGFLNDSRTTDDRKSA